MRSMCQALLLIPRTPFMSDITPLAPLPPAGLPHLHTLLWPLRNVEIPKACSQVPFLLSLCSLPSSIPNYMLMTQMDVAIPNFSSELQTRLSKCLFALSPGMSHRHLKRNVCKTEPMKQTYVKASSSMQMLPPSIHLLMLKSWCVLNHNSHVLSVTNVC